MFGVVRDTEALLDEACHAISGPELVVPSVSLGALKQELLQLAKLLVGQTRRGAGWAWPPGR